MIQAPPSLSHPPLPRHVAIIMDGNGRWATLRGRSRPFGHRAGVRAARRVVRAAHRAGVPVLTLFAFSQENWHRPQNEVELLIQLFVHTLAREIGSLGDNDIRISFIGDHSGFPETLREQMKAAADRTRDRQRLHLVVAAGYGGQWDVAEAARRASEEGVPIDAAAIESRLDTAGTPAPDLLIRTGGERRISNFMLWQLAYSELYFTDTLWPDFGEVEFEQALAWFGSRQRRFGRVPASA